MLVHFVQLLSQDAQLLIFGALHVAKLQGDVCQALDELWC